MEIYLVRHAKSDYDWDRWPTDDVRPLSDKGRKRQHRVSVGIAFLEIEFDEIWCSPYQRARETFGIIQKYVSPHINPIFIDELVVSGSPSRVVKMIMDKYHEAQDTRLLLVGHNHNISSILRQLSGENIDMRTSDMAHIRIENSEIELVQFYPRKELMKLT